MPPTATAVPPTATTAPPTATPVPTKAAAAPRKFVIKPGSSKVSLAVKEQFAQLNFPSDAVLSTDALTGQIVVLPDGKIDPENSKITLELGSLTSDDPDRDRNIKENYLNVGRFPVAEFRPKEFRGIPSPPPASGPLKGQLVGDAVVRGQTKQLVWDFDGAIADGAFKGTARSQSKISELGVEVPHQFFLLSVEDNIRYQLDLNAVEEKA